MNTYGFGLKEIEPNLYKLSGKFIPSDKRFTVVNWGKFHVYCNYSKQINGSADPYQANHLLNIEQEAIEHCLMSISTRNKKSTDEFKCVKIQ